MEMIANSALREMAQVDWAVNLPENRGRLAPPIQSGVRRTGVSRTAIHPFTRFSHEYSIEADRQTSPFRIRSSQYSISEHKYPRFVVAANQGLIRLLSLLSSRPLERKMTEKVRFPSLFSLGFAIFDDITRKRGREQMRSDAS